MTQRWFIGLLAADVGAPHLALVVLLSVYRIDTGGRGEMTRGQEDDALSSSTIVTN